MKPGHVLGVVLFSLASFGEGGEAICRALDRLKRPIPDVSIAVYADSKKPILTKRTRNDGSCVIPRRLFMAKFRFVAEHAGYHTVECYPPPDGGDTLDIVMAAKVESPDVKALANLNEEQLDRKVEDILTGSWAIEGEMAFELFAVEDLLKKSIQRTAAKHPSLEKGGYQLLKRWYPELSKARVMYPWKYQPSQDLDQTICSVLQPPKSLLLKGLALSGNTVEYRSRYKRAMNRKKSKVLVYYQMSAGKLKSISYLFLLSKQSGLWKLTHFEKLSES